MELQYADDNALVALSEGDLQCIFTAKEKRLRKRVFENHNLQAKTKLLVYKAVVLPTLLYGSET